MALARCCKCGYRTLRFRCPKCSHSICTSCKLIPVKSTLFNGKRD